MMHLRRRMKVKHNRQKTAARRRHCLWAVCVRAGSGAWVGRESGSLWKKTEGYAIMAHGTRIHALVAQGIERSTPTRKVAGSIPARRATSLEQTPLLSQPLNCYSLQGLLFVFNSCNKTMLHSFLQTLRPIHQYQNLLLCRGELYAKGRKRMSAGLLRVNGGPVSN